MLVESVIVRSPKWVEAAPFTRTIRSLPSISSNPPQRMLLKEAERMEDGASSCSDLDILHGDYEAFVLQECERGGVQVLVNLGGRLATNASMPSFLSFCEKGR